jgi:hypothetical protein
MTIQVFSNSSKVEARFKLESTSYPRRIVEATNDAGMKLLMAVKEEVTGIRAGPKVITGQYFNSMGLQSEFSDVRSTQTVGTDEERGWLLELGGFTQLGKNQVYVRPHPHFGPALDRVGERFIVDIERILAGLRR